MPKIVHVGYRSPLASSMAWLQDLLGFTRGTSRGVRVISAGRRH